MKANFRLLVIVLITTLVLIARADDEVTIDIPNTTQVIEQLEQSGVVHAAALEAVKKYAVSKNYVQTLTSINPLQANDSRYFILSIWYKPKNAGELKSYPAINVNVYFIIPSHFETTIGKRKLNFYKIETTVHLINQLAPEPGDATSSGRHHN